MLEYEWPAHALPKVFVRRISGQKYSHLHLAQVICLAILAQLLLHPESALGCEDKREVGWREWESAGGYEGRINESVRWDSPMALVTVLLVLPCSGTGIEIIGEANGDGQIVVEADGQSYEMANGVVCRHPIRHYVGRMDLRKENSRRITMKAPYAMTDTRPVRGIGVQDKVYFSRFVVDPEVESDDYDDLDEFFPDCEEGIDEFLDNLFYDDATIYIEE